MEKFNGGDVEKSALKEVSKSQKIRKTCYGVLIVGLMLYIVTRPLLVGTFVTVKDVVKKVHSSCTESLNTLSDDDLCPQGSSLVPSSSKALWTELIEDIYRTDSYKNKLAEELSGAVQHPTESHDGADPVGVDPIWDVFKGFGEYLQNTYPLIHSTLEVTNVNTYALLYYWRGSDPSLKPLLLAAHQDVVPVNPETSDEWTHPPYSGYIDGEYIWGRGSSDDKSGLIAIMNTVEGLIKKGFEPTRSIVMSFGIDEETSGRYGAGELGKYMLERFGEDSIAMIVDEGGGFKEQYGAIVAEVAVGEKGYMDMQVEVSSPGGHSSIPPQHTSIGILSALLVKYEDAVPPAHFERNTPFYNTMQCLAAHTPEFPKKLKRELKKSAKSDKALKKVQEILMDNRDFRARITTTQAVDLIGGGVKINALPEQAWAVINHRIMTQSSVDAVKERATKLLHKQAEKFNLTYNAFGETIISDVNAPRYGSLALTDAWGLSLEPAPISPTYGDDGAPYQLLSGTIKAAYNAQFGSADAQSSDIIVSPGIMTGNTDTRYYWKLTEHIFRYNHGNGNGQAALSGVHTVNEHISIDTLVGKVQFFTTLILNADESTSF